MCSRNRGAAKMCIACAVVDLKYSLVVCVIVFTAGSSHVTAESGGGVRGARFTLTGGVKGAAAARDAIRCARRRVQAASGDQFEVDGCRNVTGDSTVNNDTPVLHRVPQEPLAVNPTVASGVAGPEATLDMSTWTCSPTACYKIVIDDPGSQAASRAKCRALHPAVDLLVIDNEDEWLYFYMELYLSHLFTPTMSYWLGIEETTNTRPGTWVDGSGAPVVFEKWTSGEPNGDSETCAAVNFQVNTWVDFDCGQTAVNYVCKFRR